MIFLSRKGRGRFANGRAPIVRYQVAGREIDISRMNGKVEKLLRGQMEKQVLKFLDRHGDLTHPVTGEQPDFIFLQAKPGDMKIQMRLATDSKELISWLKAKGLEIAGGEASPDDPEAPGAAGAEPPAPAAA